MLPETEMLLQKGVEEKRKGNFSKAIMFYKKAIEIEPDKNIPILYISLAKTQYLIGDTEECFDNYVRALYYQIIEISHLIDINRLSDFDYQVEILMSYHNTIRHMSYAYAKKYDCIIDFNKLLKNKGYFISYNDLYSIINYLLDNYAYDLASGGIDYPPDIPNVFSEYSEVDWNELFIINGMRAAHTTINWESLWAIVIMNKGLKY